MAPAGTGTGPVRPMRLADAGDLFGRALRHWHAGEHGVPLTLRRDDGYADRRSPGFWFADRLWRAEAAVIDWVRGPVLDLGCGAGRHLGWLRRLEIPAFGIDASRGAVRVCRARDFAAAEGDALDLDPGLGPFATALLFGHNLGLGGSGDGVVRLLSGLDRVLRPDGRIVLTSQDVRGTAEARHRAYAEANRAAGRPAGAQILRVEYDGREGGWFPWLHATPEELRAYAAAAGWRVVHRAPVAGGSYGAVLSRA